MKLPNVTFVYLKPLRGEGLIKCASLFSARPWGIAVVPCYSGRDRLAVQGVQSRSVPASSPGKWGSDEWGSGEEQVTVGPHRVETLVE